jgi:hypothetical protein
MNRILIARFPLVVFCVCALTACQSDSKNVTGAETLSEQTTAVMRSKPASIDAPRMLLRKPLAPISIDYEIIGTPVIGIPLSINVKISSTLNQPIRMNYRIIDTTSLMFADAQAQSTSLILVDAEAFATEQITVVPQREGRLYLNVSAEIETQVGMMAKVMAIPIQVGSLQPALLLNGTITIGKDGEGLISMPAKE